MRKIGWKKGKKCGWKIIGWAAAWAVALAGCGINEDTEGNLAGEEKVYVMEGDPIEERVYAMEGDHVEERVYVMEGDPIEEGIAGGESNGMEEKDVGGNPMESEAPINAGQAAEEPEIVEAEWGEYFAGLNGAAVVYDASNRQYMIYNSELASTRRYPCSTFKIISSLIALEEGIMEPDDSVRTWSGEVFWNENWNKNMEFNEAFSTSCVWYFRQVIDEIGKERMQEGLDKLDYGNCDISDWEGRQNTNNSNRALTGFWIESSLKIAPKEQVDVMECIFGGNSVYSEKTKEELKEVMLVAPKEETGISIYGKTGMGKAGGVVVDAWFTGFAERAEGNLYFCIYLGRTEDADVTSSKAKEIAVQMISDRVR